MPPGTPIISRKQASSRQWRLTACRFGKTVAKLWARNPRHLLQQGMTEIPNRNGFVATGSNPLGTNKKKSILRDLKQFQFPSIILCSSGGERGVSISRLFDWLFQQPLFMQ